MANLVKRVIAVFFLFQIVSVVNFFTAKAANDDYGEGSGVCQPCGNPKDTNEVALLDALKFGNVEQVKNILDKNKVDVNQKMYYWLAGPGCGQCEHAPLIAIVMDSRLLHYRYEKDNVADEVRKTTEIIKLLLSRGADPNATYENEPILVMAVHFLYEEVVEALLSKGADPNVKDKRGLSVIWSTRASSDYASNPFFNNRTTDVQRRIYNILEMLFSKGAYVDARDNDGSTMLMEAATSCDKKMVEFLISKGADVNVRYLNKRTLLETLETRSGCPQVKEILISKSGELKAGSFGRVFYDCDIEVAKTLLPKIKDINERNSQGYTPLFLVMYSNEPCKKKIDMASLLLSYGADINAKDNSGMTVLMVAIIQQRLRPDKCIIEWLLSKGADPNAKDINGASVLTMAASLDSKDTAELLRSKGAVDVKESYDEIIAKCSEAIKLNPNDIKAYYRRASAYYFRGYENKVASDYDKAISDYSKVIELTSGNVRYNDYLQRGFAYTQKGEDNFAIADYSKVIEMNPGNTAAYENRARAYYRKGEYDKAWADVHSMESLKAKIPEKFISDLKKASGRDR